jgi:hypothetical protein
MYKVALEQVFSEYFGFPCQSLFRQFLHSHHHLSSGAGTIGQYWPQYQETQSRPTKNNKKLKKKIMNILKRTGLCSWWVSGFFLEGTLSESRTVFS